MSRAPGLTPIAWAVSVQPDPPVDFTPLWSLSYQLMREVTRRLDKLSVDAVERYGIDRLRMVHGSLPNGARASWVECDSRRVTPMVVVRFESFESLRVVVTEVE